MTRGKWLWVAFLVLLAYTHQYVAQSVQLPPARTEIDYFLQLTSPALSDFLLSYERRYNWGNNILALNEGDRKILPRYQVTTSSPFYATDKLTRWELSYRRWCLEFAEGTVSLIRGNTDAAQIWLDSKSKSINPQKFYQPFATEQKGHWRWFGLSHSFPFTLRQGCGELAVNFRYLLCNRFRDGWLLGSYYGNRLLGEIQFVSSRGINFNAPTGRGFSFDTNLSLRWNKWRAIAAIEGLYGRVRWEKLRKVSAFVDTNAFAEDPDGFLHSLPSFVGREDYIPIKRPIDCQWILGLGYHQSHWLWGIAMSERNEGHNWHIRVTRYLTSQQTLTLALRLPNRIVSLGYHSPNFVLLLSLSHPDPSRALALGVQVRFIVK